jgi:hypothetical protein
MSEATGQDRNDCDHHFASLVGWFEESVLVQSSSVGQTTIIVIAWKLSAGPKGPADNFRQVTISP